MKFLALLATLLVTVSLTPLQAQGWNPDSALGALNSLPPAYRNGVVYISADNAITGGIVSRR